MIEDPSPDAPYEYAEEQPGTRRYCRRCFYDVTGVEYAAEAAASLCPECGRPFDPDDPRSTLAAPTQPVSRWLAKWVLVPAIIGVFVLFALTQGWIPRPAVMGAYGRTSGLALWEWRGLYYGSHTGAFGPGGLPVRVWQWGDPLGRATRVSSVDDEGRLRWRVERDGALWTLRVERPGVHHHELLFGFNATRDSLFGLEVVASSALPAETAYQVTGDETEVMEEMIRRHTLVVRPFATVEGEDLAWWYEEDAGQLVLKNADWVRAQGFDLRTRAPEPRALGGWR